VQFEGFDCSSAFLHGFSHEKLQHSDIRRLINVLVTQGVKTVRFERIFTAAIMAAIGFG